MNNKNEKLIFFTYCRKSSEDKERQIASIDDQTDAANKLAKSEDLNVKEVLMEERSAKQPGRIVFNSMLDRIERGEANAILCWDIDRLYRNPVDEGRLRWMLQKGVIKMIKTPYRVFYPDDAGLLMGVEGGRATDYVIRLSKNVRRGLNSRIAKGWRPNLAPIGYLNVGEKGDKIIIPDTERFEIIREMWDLFLSGQYLVSKVLDIANNKRGLRTVTRKKLGGKPLSLSQAYKMFNDPFYYGCFPHTNPDTGEIELVQGKHTPMVTDKEYRRAQVLLGSKGKQQPQTREFAFTGIIRCGECNSMITAEEKHHLTCTTCKHKFSYENNTACPKCKIDISDMNKPTIKDYYYYRCSKKNKNHKCKQKFIQAKELETQINEILLGLKIDEEYLKIALEYLQEKRDNSLNAEIQMRDMLQSTLNNCQTRLNNLNKEYTSVQNIKHELYSPEEFAELKKEVLNERKNIEAELGKAKSRIDQSLELTERTFNFCAYAFYHFNTTDLQKKREIFSTIGSNLTLKDKILSIERLHPYLLIENELKSQRALFSTLEPTKSGYIKEWEALFRASILTWRRVLDEVRTSLMLSDLTKFDIVKRW
jgi:site-specific DNA recombinase